MEQLNRIQLRGIIGTVRISEVQGRRLANFTVATNVAFKDAEGMAVIETTWHNVVAWENGSFITDFSNLEKGKAVFVEGLLEYQIYTGDDGNERRLSRVRAWSLNIIEEPLTIETI